MHNFVVLMLSYMLSTLAVSTQITPITGITKDMTLLVMSFFMS